MVVEVNKPYSSTTIAMCWSRRQQVLTFRDGSRVGSVNSTESYVFNTNIRNKLHKVHMYVDMYKLTYLEPNYDHI